MRMLKGAISSENMNSDTATRSGFASVSFLPRFSSDWRIQIQFHQDSNGCICCLAPLPPSWNHTLPFNQACQVALVVQFFWVLRRKKKMSGFSFEHIYIYLGGWGGTSFCCFLLLFPFQCFDPQYFGAFIFCHFLFLPFPCVLPLFLFSL